MKVSVTFSEARYAPIPFEVNQNQLIVLLGVLKHYTGTGCQMEIEMEQRQPKDAVIEACSFEDLSRAVEGAAAVMREGARMEVDEDE